MHFLSVVSDIDSCSGCFKVRREKRGKKPQQLAKRITEIHAFTKSVLQRGGKNMNLYLQVHHLTNASCQKSVPSIKK